MDLVLCPVMKDPIVYKQTIRVLGKVDGRTLRLRDVSVVELTIH